MGWRNVYICHSLGLKDVVEKIVRELEREGCNVYFPARDTPQGNDVDANMILQCNYNGLKNADIVYCYWDGTSQGTLFDLGMAYALGIPVQFDRVHRTWSTFIYNLCKEETILERKE